MREADARGALAQYRAALDIDRGLANADKDNSQAILDLSFSESKAGSALGKLGQTQEALVLLRSGVARQESLVASYSRPSLIYHHLANSYTRLANCLLDSGDRKVAAEYYRKAVNARLTLAEKSPGSNWNRGSLAECYTNLAKALGPDNPGDALKQYNKAIELLDPLTAADRSNVTVRIALADALSNAARLHVQMAGRDEEPSTRLEDWNRAKSFYERSLGLWLELERTGKLPPDGNVAMNNVRNELARCNDSVAKLQQVH